MAAFLFENQAILPSSLDQKGFPADRSSRWAILLFIAFCFLFFFSLLIGAKSLIFFNHDSLHLVFIYELPNQFYPILHDVAVTSIGIKEAASFNSEGGFCLFGHRPV